MTTQEGPGSEPSPAGPPHRQRMQLGDSLILLAGAAVGFAIWRDYAVRFWWMPMSRGVPAQPGVWSQINRTLQFWTPALLTPIALTMFVMAIREPRPALRDSVKRPGMAALVLIAAQCAVVGLLISIRVVFLSQAGVQGGTTLISFLTAGMGESIGVAWLILHLTRRNEAATFWYEKMGYGIGAAWIALAVEGHISTIVATFPR